MHTLSEKRIAQSLAHIGRRNGFRQDRSVYCDFAHRKRITGNHDEWDVSSSQVSEGRNAATIAEVEVDNRCVDLVAGKVLQGSSIARLERVMRAETFQLEMIVDRDHRIVFDDKDSLAAKSGILIARASTRPRRTIQHGRTRYSSARQPHTLTLWRRYGSGQTLFLRWTSVKMRAL
jgi:hypothetical protein